MAQNSCAEAMLTFVAPKCGLPAIRFTNVTQNDHQIPLNAALIIPDTSIFSRDRDNLREVIKTLDPGKSYFLRVGLNSGAGHWSVLHRIPNQGWQLNSSPTSNCMLTTRDNHLIETGAYSILGNPDGTARWGYNHTEYSIAIWEATRKRVIDSINFVCGFRSSTSNNPNICEDEGTKLMEACEGRLVENHPYLTLMRPVEVNPNPEPFTFENYDAALDVFFRNIYECKTVQGANYLYTQYFWEAFNKLEGDALRNNAARHTTTRLKKHAHLTGLHRDLLTRVEAHCDDIKIAENPWLSNDILQICAALSGVVMGGLILGGMIVFPASLLIGALLTTVSTLAIGYKLYGFFESSNDGDLKRQAAVNTF